jgi:LysM repeat protein
MGYRTLIRVGQNLKIPTRRGRSSPLADGNQATEHTVRRGQCLASIAARYGVTVGQLQRANQIADPSRIYAGQRLRIPGAGGSTRQTPTHQVTVSRQGADKSSAPATSPHPGASMNVTDSLGRVASTAHIVAEAREAIRRQQDQALADELVGQTPCYHTVKRGETLSGIAARYKATPPELRRWNGLRGDRIYPGQELLVTSPTSEEPGPARLHVVKRGESLWTIARRYQVRIADLQDWNSLRRSSTIYPGQKLLVY